MAFNKSFNVNVGGWCIEFQKKVGKTSMHGELSCPYHHD